MITSVRSSRKYILRSCRVGNFLAQLAKARLRLRFIFLIHLDLLTGQNCSQVMEVREGKNF